MPTLQFDMACRLPLYQSTGTASGVAYGFRICGCGGDGVGCDAWKTSGAAPRPKSPDMTTMAIRISAGRNQR